MLSNPPFGRKSSLTMVRADGREAREIERQDFVVTTSNKQLNFVQHLDDFVESYLHLSLRSSEVTLRPE